MKELIEIFELCIFTSLQVGGLAFGVMMIFSLLYSVWERL